MVDIPADIELVIDTIDRKHILESVPNSKAPIDRYDNLLRSLFPEFQIVNITEFDYGRSYRYLVTLSENVNAGALDDAVFLREVELSGSIDQVTLAISAIAPYFLLSFIHSSAGKIKQRSENPSNVAQDSAGKLISAALNDLGLKRLAEEVSTQIVSDVSTELCELGEATVADCLFYG